MIRSFALFLIAGASAFADPVYYLVEPIPAPTGLVDVSMSGINDSGQVAGYGFTGTTEQAFIGTVSGSMVLPLPNGWIATYAYAINDSGQVAGTVSNGTPNQAFIGTTSGSTVLPLPSGWSEALGYAINDAGQVAG